MASQGTDMALQRWFAWSGFKIPRAFLTSPRLSQVFTWPTLLHRVSHPKALEWATWPSRVHQTPSYPTNFLSQMRKPNYAGKINKSEYIYIHGNLCLLKRAGACFGISKGRWEVLRASRENTLSLWFFIYMKNPFVGMILMKVGLVVWLKGVGCAESFRACLPGLWFLRAVHLPVWAPLKVFLS